MPLCTVSRDVSWPSTTCTLLTPFVIRKHPTCWLAAAGDRPICWALGGGGTLAAGGATAGTGTAAVDGNTRGWYRPVTDGALCVARRGQRWHSAMPSLAMVSQVGGSYC